MSENAVTQYNVTECFPGITTERLTRETNFEAPIYSVAIALYEEALTNLENGVYQPSMFSLYPGEDVIGVSADEVDRPYHPGLYRISNRYRRAYLKAVFPPESLLKIVNDPEKSDDLNIIIDVTLGEKRYGYTRENPYWLTKSLQLYMALYFQRAREIISEITGEMPPISADLRAGYKLDEIDDDNLKQHLWNVTRLSDALDDLNHFLTNFGRPDDEAAQMSDDEIIIEFHWLRKFLQVRTIEGLRHTCPMTSPMAQSANVLIACVNRCRPNTNT